MLLGISSLIRSPAPLGSTELYGSHFLGRTPLGFRPHSIPLSLQPLEQHRLKHNLSQGSYPKKASSKAEAITLIAFTTLFFGWTAAISFLLNDKTEEAKTLRYIRQLSRDEDIPSNISKKELEKICMMIGRTQNLKANQKLSRLNRVHYFENVDSTLLDLWLGIGTSQRLVEDDSD